MNKETKTSSRVASSPKKSNMTPLLAGGGAVAVALVGYLGLCAVAQSSNNILSDVTVGGISVGGMSKTQALETVRNNINDELANTAVTLSSSTWTGIVDGNVVMPEIDSAIEEAYAMGRDSFFSSGFQFLMGSSGGEDDIYVPLTFSEEGLAQFHALLDEADAAMNGSVVQSSWQLDLENDQLVINKGVSGMAVDRVAAQEATLEALSTRSTNNVPLNTDTTEPINLNFDQVREEIFIEPANAQLDTATMEVGDHVVGIDLHTTTASSQYMTATEGETFSVSLIVTQPEQTKELVQSSLFSDVLAQTSSLVTGTAVRKKNVELATGYSNTIVLPGENFSFYEQCGPWTVANGYGGASAYVGGATVTELAGGVCQASSTIYYAVLHTDLEVVERSKHMYSVDYLPLGMDATIYSTSLDLKFKNNTDFPIKIVAETNYRNGNQYTDVTILGTKTSDVTIKPISTVFNHTAGGTQYVANSSIPAGTTSRVQSAYSGSSVTVSRNHYDANGSLIKEETLYTETYSSRPAIIHYNPNDGVPNGSGSSSTTTTEPEPEEPSTDTGMDLGDSTEGTTPDTSVPDTTTPTPETSTPTPETSTPAPETTTPTPETTTPAPETSTPAPEASTPAPEASTPAPETAAPTPAPEAAAPAPEAAAPAPEVSTPAPDTGDAGIPGL